MTPQTPPQSPRNLVCPRRPKRVKAARQLKYTTPPQSPRKDVCPDRPVQRRASNNPMLIFSPVDLHIKIMQDTFNQAMGVNWKVPGAPTKQRRNTRYFC